MGGGWGCVLWSAGLWTLEGVSGGRGVTAGPVCTDRTYTLRAPSGSVPRGGVSTFRDCTLGWVDAFTDRIPGSVVFSERDLNVSALTL